MSLQTGLKENSELLSALSKLMEVAEEKIPANPRAPVNQRQARAFQGMIAKYFRQLETAFPYRKVADLYGRYVEE